MRLLPSALAVVCAGGEAPRVGHGAARRGGSGEFSTAPTLVPPSSPPGAESSMTRPSVSSSAHSESTSERAAWRCGVLAGLRRAADWHAVVSADGDDGAGSDCCAARCRAMCSWASSLVTLYHRRTDRRTLEPRMVSQKYDALARWLAAAS